MGVDTEKARVGVADQYGTAEANVALDERQFTEDTRASIAGLMGTDAQIAGFDMNESLVPFTDRWALDPGYVGLLTRSDGKDAKSAGLQSQIESNLTNANALAQEAEDLARAGDYSGAAAKRAEAEAALTYAGDREQMAKDAKFAALGDSSQILSKSKFLRKQIKQGAYTEEELLAMSPEELVALDPKLQKQVNKVHKSLGRDDWYPLANSEQVKGAFKSVKSARAHAEAAASTTDAKTVGKLMREGEQILDRESETSKRLVAAITDPGIRAIDAEERFAREQMRDQARRRGGVGASAYASRAVEARASEKFAMHKANVYSKAEAFYQDFRVKFSQSIAQFSQDWLNNVSGVRDNFQNAMDQLHNLVISTARDSAAVHMEFGQQSEARAQASSARTDAFIGMGVGAITTIGAAALGGSGGGENPMDGEGN